MTPPAGSFVNDARRRGRVALALAAWSAALLVSADSARAQPPPVHDEKGRPVTPSQPSPAPRRIVVPVLETFVEPDYPSGARHEGREADVILKITIEVDGHVSKAVIVDPVGHGFDEAARDAALRLRFEPARDEAGEPFAATIKFRFEFRLPEVEPGPKPAAAGPAEPADAERGTPSPPPTTEALPTTDVTTPSADAAVIEVFVEGEQPPREVTKRTLEKRVIERIPGTGGDALKSIQSLPGVARAPGFFGTLLVRGSAPFDTQTFVDGIYVPLIYHFGGLSSVVPTELLSKIDFYPGNYSARYGRALGGIVDAGIRSPRSDALHGLAQIDLIDARLMLEGPIPFLEGWSFAAAGRRSYFDAWLGPVLESAGAGVTQAPRYWDYQFIVERRHESDHLRVSFYGSDDALKLLLKEPPAGEPALSGNAGLSTAFQRLQVGYVIHPDEHDVLDTQLSFGREVIRVGIGSLFIDLKAYTVFARSEYSHRLARRAKLNVGFDMVVSAVDVAQRIPADSPPGQPGGQPLSTQSFRNADQVIPVYQPALYVESELTPISRWRIVPGIRLDYSRDVDRVEPNPRLNTRVDIVDRFPRTTVKAGVGLFSQPPQPQESNLPLGTPGIGFNRSLQYALGAEQQLSRQLEVSLEGFYKQLEDIVVPRVDGSKVVYTNEADGNVIGAELLLKYNPDERFFGWIAYTLSRSLRRNAPDEPAYPVPWDQTHNLVMLGSFRVGGGWEVGARFRLVSGPLVDTYVCDNSKSDCDPSRINALYHAASGSYTPLPLGTNNGERLAPFHQLDLRIDKAWRFTSWKLSAYLDVQNVYNSPNAEALRYDYRYSRRSEVRGIPVLPSLGLRGEF